MEPPLQRTLAIRDAATAVAAARRALAGGELSTAERICREVLAVAPGAAGAWSLLTETALLRQRPQAAIICADRAVALTPDDPIAHVMRAKCLLYSGEPGQALAAAEMAANIVGATPQAREAPQALDALGAIFGLLGRHQRAAELFRRAVAVRPDVAQYLFNLAATERMTGMLAAAEDHCDAAIARDRHYGLAHYLRSDLRMQTRERNHIAEMEALVLEGKLKGHDQVMLRFALCKEYEDID